MTFDARTERHLKSLDPKAERRFRLWLQDAQDLASEVYGVEYKVISGNRTWAEQDALYAQGRTKPGRKVTNAKGGWSNHNFGIAIDCGVFKDGKYLDEASPALAARVHRAVARDVKAYGMEWGGNWTSLKDYPHFEISTALSMKQKRDRYLETGSVL